MKVYIRRALQPQRITIPPHFLFFNPPSPFSLQTAHSPLHSLLYSPLFHHTPLSAHFIHHCGRSVLRTGPTFCSPKALHWDGRQNGINGMVSERVSGRVLDMEGSWDGRQSDPRMCLRQNHNSKCVSCLSV